MFTLAELVLIALIAFGGAALQGSIGFGLGVVGVPLLTLVDPRLTPIPVQMAALFLAVAATWRERAHLDTDGIGWIIAGRVPGA